jgi:quinol-cytochrome oxidoreductase complex cytochrome b subunit
MSALGDRLGRVCQAGWDWLSPRWAGPKRALEFLNKPLPRNVGWLHTLGGLLLVYILFQVFTGVLLGFYYSPSVDSAYQSYTYIREELFLGRFLTNLHRFGAGFVIVTVFLHLLRSYFMGSYKKPRELLWISGLMLGVLLTLFAFTGQLLPYDQRGYWATVVGIRIASSAPGAGDTVRDLLTGGYGDIGAVTLSRFYILHVSVLPLVLFALIGLHLSILQKTGSSGPSDGSTPEPVKTFYPSQAVKDVLVAAGGALALCAVAVLVTSQDTGPANPAAGNFTPRPEWYFLSHYEILRRLPGGMQVLGTFVLPNALLAVLMALPFLDRGPDRHWKKRKFWVAAGALISLGVVGLTAGGIYNAPVTHTQAATEDQTLTPAEYGETLFREKKCIQCHTINGEGKDKGPDLSHVATRLREDFLPNWVRNPRNFKTDTDMPAFEGTEDELDAIVAYLLTLE